MVLRFLRLYHFICDSPFKFYELRRSWCFTAKPCFYSCEGAKVWTVPNTPIQVFISLKSSTRSLTKATRMGFKPEEHGDNNVVSEDRLQGKPLENVQTSFIKPSTATSSEKEWLYLSSLDYLWIPFYTPILCTFTLTEVHNLRVVQHLKDSLADVLVLFYPLAGRVLAKGGPPRIHCNDAGAVFTEASVDVDLADLRTYDFQPQPLLSGLAASGLGDYPLLSHIDTGLPALVIQVTHFKCGGITLAANWAHAVADGQAGFHFMNSWSELARGLQVSLLPDHRRELVKPRDSSAATTCPFSTSAVLSAGAQILKNTNRRNSGECEPEFRKQAKIIPKIVEFTGDDISILKQRGLAGSETQQLSRADCLSTHVWRTVTRARNVQPGSATRLCILVEGRKKLLLPPGYFGNVVNLLFVVTTVSELLNCPFGCTASLVHSAVGSTTTEWFQNLVDFMPLVLVSGKADLSFEDPAFPGAAFAGISYLNRFPFYELDFGFGVPAHSVRNTMAARDGLFFVVPSSRGRENVVVMANMDSDLVNNFLSSAHDISE